LIKLEEEKFRKVMKSLDVQDRVITDIVNHLKELKNLKKEEDDLRDKIREKQKLIEGKFSDITDDGMSTPTKQKKLLSSEDMSYVKQLAKFSRCDY